MIDPLTALSVASTAVGQMRSLIRAGQDTTAAMSKFAGAWADINEAERQAKNPSFFHSFSGSLEARAANAFAAKKKAEALKKELESMIQAVYGPTGLREYKDILRNMRKTKEETEFKRARFKRAILEWTFGTILVIFSVGLLGVLFYFIGKSQGKW